MPLVEDAVRLLSALPSRFTKGGSVFLYRGARLIEENEGKQPNRRYIKPWDAACEAAKVEGAGFHSTRHTFASNYIMRGGNLFDLCRICGWSDFKMVEETYGHLTANYLQDAMARMQGAAGKIPEAPIAIGGK